MRASRKMLVYVGGGLSLLFFLYLASTGVLVSTLRLDTKQTSIPEMTKERPHSPNSLSTGNFPPKSSHQGSASSLPNHIRPATFSPERKSDLSDTFSTYGHAQDCELNSLRLHLPIDPSCPSRTAVLEAMSYGGRAGFDQPYIPYGCDFRWYTTEEICNILGRFSHIFIVGDSLQRMMINAIHMLLREDMGLGGVAEWLFEERGQIAPGATTNLTDCMCEDQFRRHECSTAYIPSFRDLVDHSSIPVCGITSTVALPFNLSYHQWQGFPSSHDEHEDLLSALPSPDSRPSKPLAFVMHHSYWNNVNYTATVAWLDELVTITANALPFLPRPGPGMYFAPGTKGFPRLFVTANAPGVREDMITIDGRTSQTIAKFEKEIQPHLRARDIELLGFYNMSVQTSSNDNYHANMRTNLLKAMMVMNWLDWVGREEGQPLNLSGGR